jgi:hypothetical protein
MFWRRLGHYAVLIIVVAAGLVVLGMILDAAGVQVPVLSQAA